jgi:hypothetical protein
VRLDHLLSKEHLARSLYGGRAQSHVPGRMSLGWLLMSGALVIHLAVSGDPGLVRSLLGGSRNGGGAGGVGGHAVGS